MKKILWCVLTLLLPANEIFGQVNLVPNYSFEVHDTCPYTTYGGLQLATPWFPARTDIGSSDYYNACATVGGFNVPANGLAYQKALSGVAYAGFIEFAPQLREYIEVQLTDTLRKGKKYCVKFYVSLADSSKYATGTIGAYLSKDSLIDFSAAYTGIIISPKIINDPLNIINDTTQWVAISGEFIADGGEKFLTIGNFNSDANSTIETVSAGGFQFAYYFVDNVSVALCNPHDLDIDVPGGFSPNDDGSNDYFVVKNLPAHTKLFIYNRWGNVVFKSTNYDNTWNGGTLPEGTYYYLLVFTDGETKKGFVELRK